MLAEGKITAEEVDRLLEAIGRGPASPGSDRSASRRNLPKYLRVVIDTDEDADGPTKVNVRVPLQLLRAGVQMSSVIPPQARTKINEKLKAQGVDFDVFQIRPDNMDAMIEQLQEFSVDIDQERTKVRVFCE